MKNGRQLKQKLETKYKIDKTFKYDVFVVGLNERPCSH